MGERNKTSVEKFRVWLYLQEGNGQGARLPPLLKDPSEGVPSCVGKDTEWGAPAISTRFILHAAFFVGGPEKKGGGMANHPSQNEGPQEKGFFWLLTVSKVRNKGKILCLLRKQNLHLGF